MLPGELNADASLGIFFMLCRAAAPLKTVAMNRHICKAGSTRVFPSVSPGVSSPACCVSEPQPAEKRCYEHTEVQNWDGTQCSCLLPRRLTQLKASLEPQLPSFLHLQLCSVASVWSALHQLPINRRLKSDVKNLLLTSCAQIFEKSPHPPQEEEAENKRDWSPKISLAINSGAREGKNTQDYWTSLVMKTNIFP